MKFEQAHQVIMRAGAFSDVFKIDPKKSKEENLDSVKTQYRQLSLLVHPDKNKKHQTEATEAFAKLGQLYKEAQGVGVTSDPYENGVLKKPVSWKTKKNSYTVVRKSYAGGMCDLFDGLVNSKGVSAPVLVKIPHSHHDNDLIKREANAYDLMNKKLKSLDQSLAEFARKLSLRVPCFIEMASLELEKGKPKKLVNSFLIDPEFKDGWFTLEQIRAQYPNGVDVRVAVFILNRIFESLTLAHSVGLTHCAVTPNHVLIHAKSHMGQIVDWTASCHGSDTVPYVDEKYKGFFPPEAVDKNTVPSAKFDVFVSAMCFLYVLGIDPEKIAGHPNLTNIEPFLQFVNKCLQPNKRFNSIEVAHQNFREICHTVFGKATFVELTLAETP